MKPNPQPSLPLDDAGNLEERECSGPEFLALGEQASQGKLRILSAARDWKKGLWHVVIEHLWQKTAQPLLSTRDIVEMLDWYFRRPRSAQEVEAGVRRRHQRRARLAAVALARAKKQARKARPKIPK